MQYFGRNSFLVNILQAKSPRKFMIAGYLRAGNRGGYPPSRLANATCHPKLWSKPGKQAKSEEARPMSKFALTLIPLLLAAPLHAQKNLCHFDRSCSRFCEQRSGPKNFSSNSARKSHVKPRNHLNPTNKTRSSWHVSYVQSAILKTVEKNKQAPPGYNRPPGLTHFNAIFWTQPMYYEYFADKDTL